MWGVGLNAILGYVVVITLCFTVTDPQALLDSETGFPFIQLFFNVTKSYTATHIMTAIIIVNIVSAVISEIATASRQIWSFARDDGFPFSDFLKKVSNQDLAPQASTIPQQNPILFGSSSYRDLLTRNRSALVGTYPSTPSSSTSCLASLSRSSILAPASH